MVRVKLRRNLVPICRNCHFMRVLLGTGRSRIDIILSFGVICGTFLFPKEKPCFQLGEFYCRGRSIFSLENDTNKAKLNNYIERLRCSNGKTNFLFRGWNVLKRGERKVLGHARGTNMIEIDGIKDRDILEFAIKGRFDAQNSIQVEQQMLQWINEGENVLLGNLSELDYISSSGIHVLIRLAKSLAQADGKLALYAVPDRIKDVFEVVELHRIIPAWETKEEAIKTLR
ncbi:anti-sigma factor antagonist [bacterium]|nr:anti-sigma factor antagonist [bacterium]